MATPRSSYYPRTYAAPGAGQERGARSRRGQTIDPSWQRGRAAGGNDQLAKLLGLFSIGLGVTQLIAPREFARWIGVGDPDPVLMRALGVREVASGVGLLGQSRPTPWLWSRVGGDVMDFALLGRAMGAERSDPTRVGAALAAVAGITMLDLFASKETSRPVNGSSRPDVEERAVHVVKAVTIRRPPEEVYRYWRDFENLPRFMHHLEAVQVVDDRRLRWRAKAPAGRTVEWEAEIVEDQPRELIAWRSVDGADVPNSGQVRFRPAPAGQGSEVEVELQFDPPGGGSGRLVARLFGNEPGQEVAADLRRLKQVLETGEVVVSDATVAGAYPKQRPARPPEAVDQPAAARG